MDNIIKTINDFILLPTSVKILLLLTIIVSIIFNKKLKGILKIHLNAIINTSQKITRLDLELHKLHVKCNNYKKDFDYCDYGDIHRNFVFKTIKHSKFQSITNISKELINNADKISKLEIHKNISDNVIKIIEDYNTDIKSKLEYKYREFGTELYELVMNHSIKGFNIWHNDNKVIPINLYIEDMIEYNFRSNYEILDFYYDELNRCISTLCFDTLKTYKKFNGDFDAIINKYKLKYEN